jgi:hypothetical protein
MKAPPRIRPRRYFSRSIRRGKTVKSRHIGPMKDPLVALMYRAHRLHQATRRAHREQFEDEVRRYAEIEHRIRKYLQQWKFFLESWREDQGYRECEDGVWRPRQRKKRKPVMKHLDLKLLIKQAENGDDTALRELRMLLDADRGAWQPFGDLSVCVTEQFLDLFAGKSAVVREFLTRTLERMKEELCGKQPSPTRELAAEQVVICWLDVHYQQMLSVLPRSSKTEADYLENRLNRVRKRYSDALETLARVKAVEEEWVE